MPQYWVYFAVLATILNFSLADDQCLFESEGSMPSLHLTATDPNFVRRCMSDFYGQHFTDRIVDGSLTSAREAPLASAENGHYPEPENSLQIATSSSIIGPSDHLNVAVFTYSMSEGNLSMVVNLSDDNADLQSGCVQNSGGDCNLRSAVAACSTQDYTGDYKRCYIDIQVPRIELDNIFLMYLFWNRELHIFGNGVEIYSSYISNFLEASGSVHLQDMTISGAAVYIQAAGFASFVNVKFIGASRLTIFTALSIDIIDCAFVSNSNLHYPSETFVRIENEYGLIKIHNTTFKDNAIFYDFVPGDSIAASDVAATLYIKSTTARLDMENCEFIRNFNYVAGALQMHNVFGTIKNTVFEGNNGRAGAVYCSSQCPSIINSRFVGNFGNSGTGALSYDISKSGLITINSSIFDSNIALGNGGAVSLILIEGILSTSFTVSINNCTFNDNQGSNGGAVYFGQNQKIVTITNSIFTNNTARIDGGAVYFSTSNKYVDMFDVEFDGCISGNRGGAVFFGSGLSHVSISRIIGTYCIAAADGGVFYFDTDAFMCDLTDSWFLHNRASSGGAVAIAPMSNSLGHFAIGENYFGDGSQISSIANICNNHVIQNGGALSVEGAANVHIRDCTFFGNSASLQGGSLFFGALSRYVSVEKSQFSFNNAGSSGGAIAISIKSRIFTVIDCDFSHNKADDDGGAIFLGRSVSESIITRVSVSNCTADNGGAIAVRSKCHDILISDSTLEMNDALSDGGAILLGSGNTNLIISNTKMMNNEATLYGAGISILSRNELIIVHDAFFSHNSALYGGGGYLGTLNKNVSFQNSSFTNNIAIVDGGGLYIDISNVDIMVKAMFRHNHALSNGGGFYIGLFNKRIHIISSLFSYNSANNGGAIYADKENQNLVVSKSDIKYNEVQFNGGGIYIGQKNNGTTLMETMLAENAAASGGGLFSSSFTIITTVVFRHNRASIGGGGSYLQGSGHYIIDAEYTMNECKYGGGGAISFSDESQTDIAIYRTDFLNNSAATTGGAIVVTGLDDLFSNQGVWVYSCTFNWNKAGIAGGALHISQSSKHEISRCSFTGNVANSEAVPSQRRLQVSAQSAIGSGGGIFFYGVKEALISHCFFSNQASAMNGGSIVLSTCQHIDIFSNVITTGNVESGSGSAAYIVESYQVSIVKNNISLNNALKGGGSVYWQYEIDFVIAVDSPLILDQLNFFSNNWAAYGNDVATSLVSISSPANISVTSYETVVDTFVINFLDYYGNIYNIVSYAFVTAEAAKSYKCNNQSPSVGGVAVASSVNGIASFYDLRLSCYPGGWMDVLFTATTIDNDEMTTIATAYFRNCHIGEVVVDRACTICPMGTYSFDESAQESCLTCPFGSKSCFGHTIEVQAGYWRSHEFSAAIYECPYGDYACKGGTLAGNESCMVGYEGPLCAVCSNGFYYSSGNSECLPCSASGLNIAGIVIIAIVSFVLLVPLCYLSAQWAFGATAETLVVDFSVDTIAFSAFVVAYSTLVPGAHEQKEELEELFNDLYARWWAQLKIALSLIQIMTALPVVTNVEFPPIFSDISNLLNQFNIDISSSFGILCQADYDYIDALIITTLTPLCFWICLWSVYAFHYIYAFVKGQTTASMVSTYGTYLWIYLFTSYMVLPGVAVTIFSTFNCHDISSTESYLRADYSVSCKSERYAFGSLWAGIFAIIYCIGIPLSYFVLLFKRRNTILTRDDPNQCTKLDLLKITPLNFLFAAYEPQFWYWEIIETTRRIILTGVLVLVAQGSPMQLIIGMVVAVFYIKLYAYYKPYDDDFVDTDAEVAQYQVFFAMFILLMIQNDLVYSGKSVLDGLLILNFFALFLFPVFRVTKGSAWHKYYSRWIGELNVVNNFDQDIELPSRKDDSDDESLGSSKCNYDNIYADKAKTNCAVYEPVSVQQHPSFAPMASSKTSFLSQFRMNGKELVWSPTILITIVPQREMDGTFNYLVTADFSGSIYPLVFEKSIGQFKSLREELHPYIVVVGFPRGMRSKYPEDSPTGWIFADTAEKSMRRANDLTSWMNELTHCEKLMSVQDAHALIATFLGCLPDAVSERADNSSGVKGQLVTPEAII